LRSARSSLLHRAKRGAANDTQSVEVTHKGFRRVVVSSSRSGAKRQRAAGAVITKAA
jgi:hypothetical protein